MRLILATALLLAFAAGCAAAPLPPAASAPAVSASGPIRVSSPDFTDGGVLPRRFTCFGAGDAPTLRWSGVPAGTAALAVTLTDSDAPNGAYTHWVVFNLPGDATGLIALPSGARQATNSAGRSRYAPPCPPSGIHHYHFTVTALRSALAASDGAPFETVEQQIIGARVIDGETVVTVSHPGGRWRWPHRGAA